MASAEAGPAGGARLPGVRGLVGGITLLLLLGVAVQPMQDPDFFWHVAAGDWIAAHGRVPTRELWTWTIPGRPWVAHEWLSELVMSTLLRHLGLGAVVLLFGLLVFLGLLLIWRAARDVPYPIRAGATLLGLAAANPILGPRTQMITFALSAAVLLLLRRHRETGSARWLLGLPPIFLLWANAHAGFVIGLAFIGAHLAGETLAALPGGGASLAAAWRARLRPPAAALLGSVAATLANPNLWRIYLYPLGALSNAALQRLVDEWKSPDFHAHQWIPYEAMILLTLALFAAAPSLRRATGRPLPHPTDVILVLATLDLSLHAVRNVVLFAAAATPVLATLLAAAWEAGRGRLPALHEPPRRPLTGAINLGLLILVGAVVGLATLPRLRQSPDGRIIRDHFPVATVDALAADPPPGRVFNGFGWGGYLIWRDPQRPVYVYGETELMGDALLDEYDSVVTLQPRFREILAARQVEWVLFPSGTPLAVALASDPQTWALARDDGQAAVLVRRDDATREWRARHGLG